MMSMRAILVLASVVCLASAERQSLTFAEVFKNNVGVPKMLLFLGDVDASATKLSLDWAADLSKALLPRTMPLAIPNEEANAKIFETFGINKQLLAGAKLPMAMVRHRYCSLHTPCMHCASTVHPHSLQSAAPLYGALHFVGLLFAE